MKALFFIALAFSCLQFAASASYHNFASKKLSASSETEFKSTTNLGVCGSNFYHTNPYTVANGNFYISLKQPNYSSNQNGMNVITTFQSIRFDPNTWLVNTGDFNYSTTTGSTTTKVPYGFATGCAGTWVPNAHSHIDLTGTPFAVDDMFVINGYLPNGNATFSQNNQVVDIWGGGGCGWTAPIAQDAIEYGAQPGGPYLKLALVKC